LGAAGEDRAAAWYRAQGYEVVARNWRCREGEIDLICTRGRTLVICEVKTRSSLAFGHPAEAVTPTKQRRLRTLARIWLADHGGPVRVAAIRFDVAAVLPGSVDVIESAF
jgi:putative endonuclease